MRSTTFLTCSLLSCGHIAKLMQSRLACCTVVVSACGSSASATACIPFGLEMASHARTLIACLLQHACNTNRNSLFLPDCCLQHALVYESIPQMSPNIISQDVDRKANAAKESLLAGHAGKHDSRRREMFGAPSQDSSPNLAPATMTAMQAKSPNRVVLTPACSSPSAGATAGAKLSRILSLLAVSL